MVTYQIISDVLIINTWLREHNINLRFYTEVLKLIFSNNTKTR